MEARVRGIGMTSVRTRRRLADRLRNAGIHNEMVLDAMVEVPRHLFVDEAMEWRAYEDCSLPCLLYTSPSPRDGLLSRMPSSA